MFNFTTQTVFNEINNKNLLVASNSKKPSLRIGNTRFNADDIIDIQIKTPSPEALAKVTFDMNSIVDYFSDNSDVKEVTARIALYVGLSMNSQDSYFANDFVYKGKPLYVEFYAKDSDSVETIAKRVVANAKKYLLFIAQNPILNVSATEVEAATENDEDTYVVTFEGVNGYEQITKAALQIYDPKAKTIDCCSNEGDYIDLVVGVPVAYKFTSGAVVSQSKKMDETGSLVNLESNEVEILPGLEAFGDYNWLIHNLRLPTAANTNFWAVTKPEMPSPGTSYTQFIVRMQAERDGIAGEVVGQRAVSVTTHVLWVAGNSSTAGTAAKQVKDAFTTLASAKIKTEADTALNNPYHIG